MASKKSEREVQADIKKGLEKAGWVVRTFNQHVKAKAGLVGWYDLVAIKHNIVLFIEVKAEGKRSAVRDSQKRLHARVEPHTGLNVQQIVADDFEQVLEVVNELSELRKSDRGKALSKLRILHTLNAWIKEATGRGEKRSGSQAEIHYSVVRSEYA